MQWSYEGSVREFLGAPRAEFNHADCLIEVPATGWQYNLSEPYSERQEEILHCRDTHCKNCGIAATRGTICTNHLDNLQADEDAPCWVADRFYKYGPTRAGDQGTLIYMLRDRETDECILHGYARIRENFKSPFNARTLATQKLQSNIELETPWPPLHPNLHVNLPGAADLEKVPYLSSPPDVINISVGRQL